MNLDVRPYIVYAVKAGSHAYGTARPESDLDIRGIFIPPWEYLVGLYTIHQKEEKTEIDDSVYYEIRKFVKLAEAANPSILELLFVDDEDILWDLIPEENREVAHLLRENRHLFLSQKVYHTYVGYAHAQLQRMQRHYQWNTMEPPQRPKPIKYYSFYPLDHSVVTAPILNEDTIRNVFGAYPVKGVRDVYWMLDTGGGIFDEQGNLKVLKNKPSGNIIALLVFNREQYNHDKKEWENYQRWIKNRNPERRKLEEKAGYDTKHAMHLIRLMRTGFELMMTGELIVRRPDADELLEIREGKWSYEKVLEHARVLEQEIQKLYKSPSCPLPVEPDREKIRELLAQLIEYGLQKRLIT